MRKYVVYCGPPGELALLLPAAHPVNLRHCGPPGELAQLCSRRLDYCYVNDVCFIATGREG